MRTLRFKVKKLYDKRKVGHCAEEFPNKHIAYQLTPEFNYCGDMYMEKGGLYLTLSYSEGDTTHVYFRGQDETFIDVSEDNPTQPFYVQPERMNQFRLAVHEYNLRYCDVPDVKVLDGFYKWNLTKNLQHDDNNGIDTNKLNNRIEMYKATLVSPESWFEESE